MKRLFGLITLLVGVAMLLWGVAHPWLARPPRFHFGVLLGSVLTGLLFTSFGYRWLLNVVDLDVLTVDCPNMVFGYRERQDVNSPGSKIAPPSNRDYS